jgi:hypothetical protein
MLDRDVGMTGALDALRRTVESLPESPARLQAEQALKRIELEVGPLPPLSAQAGGLPVQAGTSAAADAPPPGLARAAAPAPAPAPVAALDEDPDVAYTESVKRAIIDAMLDYSHPMDLQPDEWLTVAARDSEGPMMPGQVDDAMTILLRVKGSDLAAYVADRSKRDEVRKRVEVHVF